MRIIMSLWLFLIPFLANLFCSHVVLVAGQCQRDQQSLLLQLKSSLKFNVSRSVHLVKWNQNTDCCNWSGVHCVGGCVIGLNLSNESISGGIENSNGLFGLQQLQSLDLAFNQFNASQIPSRLANLTKLTYLNLSNAGFVGQIPTAISRMTRLVTLDLSTFSFSGSGLLKLENPNLKVLVQNLTELRELHLDGINISANRNDWCHALSSSLPDLQVLSLSGEVPNWIWKVSNGALTHLNLSCNRLMGLQEPYSLPDLSVLDLHYNQLKGKIPPPPPTAAYVDYSRNSFTSIPADIGLCGPPLATSCTDSNKSQPSASDSSNEFDWQFILMGIGFGIGSGLVVAPIMFSKKVNRCCDNHIDKILMVILPMVGLVYTNSHQRRIQAEEFPEDENTDEDEEEDYEFEPETEEFRGRYCVLCSKLDITRKKVIHDPNCTCHDSPPTSFSSTTSSSSSSLAVLR
ncbi:hypothetical protein Q3G72_028916 [Acer saccharum]|nr:hypothetical protein Q3G72_028916 [Acer saccharum]